MEVAIKVPGAKSAGKLEVTSPYDGRGVGTVETLDDAGVDQALKNASSVFQNRNEWLPAEERISILNRMAELMQERFDFLVDVAVAEGGKPLVDTRVELVRAIDGIRNCIECIRTERGEEVPMRLNRASMNRAAFTRKEPTGVVVALSAFNHPLNLIVHQVGPAVASGCPVIIKPAEDTPLSAFALVDLFREAGLPEAWCQPLATQDLSVAGKLLSDKRVAFFSFIGSAKVGWMLRSRLAAGTRCALEHGGVAPVLVAEDADLDDMLPLLAKGGFYHAGQVCVSVQRVYAHRSIARKVAEGLAALAEKSKVGDPASEETEIGPLIRPREVPRIETWVNEALSSNSECLTGGARQSDVFYPPTVLYNPPRESKVSRNEIFGPVICVYEYDALDDAISEANSLPYAFQAAVATRNIDTAMQAFTHLNASTVLINDHTAFRVDWMPFAGLRESGYGVGGIPYTYRDMQIEKMAVIRSKFL
ncbi:MAG: aldehyde dehydrogenase family protein [Nitrospiria bacterium]